MSEDAVTQIGTPLPLHRYDFILKVEASAHAIERICDRLSLSPEDVCQLINNGQTICLSDPRKNTQLRGRYLFYSLCDDDFFVAVLAVPETRDKCILVTVLTRAQHEADIHGEIQIGDKKRAVRSVADERGYADWCSRNAPLDPDARSSSGKYKNLRLGISYINADGDQRYFVMSGIPISFADATSVPLAQLLDRADFSHWLRDALTKRCVTYGNVTGLQLLTVQDEVIELY